MINLSINNSKYFLKKKNQVPTDFIPLKWGRDHITLENTSCNSSHITPNEQKEEGERNWEIYH